MKKAAIFLFPIIRVSYLVFNIFGQVKDYILFL